MTHSNSTTNPTESDPGNDFARAYQDLMRGEKTADTLENNLASLERKLDEMLQSFENSEAAKKLDSRDESREDGTGGLKKAEGDADEKKL